MSNNQTNSNLNCNINPYKFLRIKENPNGLFTRLQLLPSTPACNDLNSPFPVLSKDVPLNVNNKTSLRLFLPKVALQNPKTSSKLPIIVYFHGGGFIFHNTHSTIFDSFCMKLSSYTNSLVVSLNYRLAPEHRLPAAYDDCLETLRWISASYNDKRYSHDNQNWIYEYGDGSNCILMGSSAGGTLAYKLGLRVSTLVETCNPLKIKGLILHSPSFGGSIRTCSGVIHVNDPVVPLSVIDLFSNKCLPVGVGPGHDYLNLRAGAEERVLDRIRELGWRVLVTGGSRDPFVDRQIELVKFLGENGVIVRSHFNPGDSHAVEVFNDSKCDRLLIIVKDFIISCMSSAKYTKNLVAPRAYL